LGIIHSLFERAFHQLCRCKLGDRLLFGGFIKARQNGNTKFRTVPFSSYIYLGFNRLFLKAAKTCLHSKQRQRIGVYIVLPSGMDPVTCSSYCLNINMSYV